MHDDKKMLFAMDQPATGWFARLRSPFVVNGWVIPDPGNPVTGIEVKVNGQIRATTSTGLRRDDVAGVYPDRDALWSGFLTEVFVDDLVGTKVDVEVKALHSEGELTISRFHAKVKGLERVVSRRQRNWQYAEVLACPLCLGEIHDAGSLFECRQCQTTFPLRRGTPIFTKRGDVLLSHLLETNPTNPNGVDQTRIIQAHDLVLDLGAGNPRESEHYPNVVFHEFVQYAHSDVVSLCDRLPYRSGIFDAVISKAVFEHLARPWEMADELYRVLKPGGLLHVDTAFMYPLHADPYHFFNMTLHGANEIFKRFKTVRCGVQPYQTPSYAWRAQMDTALEHLHSEEWRRRISEWRDLIDGTLDTALDAKGHTALAAGVFFEGTKPDDSRE